MSIMVDPKETWDLWQSCFTDPSKQNQVNHAARFIVEHEARYQNVATLSGVPFYIVAVIHMRESSFSWVTHLANGDPLWNSDGIALATRHVPAGLGPFKSWEDGAVAALNLKWHNPVKWDIINALQHLEAYNGFAYRRHNQHTPYLWSFSNYMGPGKFQSDGSYNPDLIDNQCGCVPVLLALKAMGIDLDEVPIS